MATHTAIGIPTTEAIDSAGMSTMPALTTQHISRLISDFRWIHRGLGLIGNFSFFVGSVCFLYQALLGFGLVIGELGVWLFIIGSFGMLIGSLGEAMVRYERHRLNV